LADERATMEATNALEVFSLDNYVPLGELGSVLKFGEEPLTELSAVGWEDLETVIDELATFFPFPRYSNREWSSVKESLAELLGGGRLIVVRAIDVKAPGWQNVLNLIDEVATLHETNRPTGRVAFVLEGFSGSSLQTPKGHSFNVSLLQLPAQSYQQNIYSIQVSGKRNHTYYVNLALKVFQRRSWYSNLELSGLGNAIPSIVSIAEILKRYKVATTRKIETSLVELSDGEGSRSLQKAKIVVLMDKIASIPDVPEDADLGDQVI